MNHMTNPTPEVNGVQTREIRSDTFLKRMLRRREPVLLVFLIIAAMALHFGTGGWFLTVNNLVALMDSKVPEIFVAIGVTFLLITKDFDLSVASVMALSGMVCAWFIAAGWNVILSMLIGVIAGLLVGLLNGFLVTRLNMASFIATLGTMYIGRSLTQVISQGKPIGNMPDSFISFGTFHIGVFPWYFFLLIVVVVVLQPLIKRQKSMLKLYYIGTNERAAQMVGIKTKKQRWVMFVISSLFAALAGLILTAKARSASPIAFDKMEMDFIAASVIGGASINGGQGSVIGAVLGYLIVIMISNAMTLLGISPYWEGVIFGGVLAIAAIADAVSQNRKSA